jgi:hypothetical protein
MAYSPFINANAPVAAPSHFFLEQGIEFPARVRRRGGPFDPRVLAPREKIAEVRTIFINDPLRLSLTALIVVSAIVKLAVQARMDGPVARGTAIAKSHSLLGFKLAPAMKAIHARFVSIGWLLAFYTSGARSPRVASRRVCELRQD